MPKPRKTLRDKRKKPSVAKPLAQNKTSPSPGTTKGKRMAVSPVVQKFYDSMKTFQDRQDTAIAGVTSDVEAQAALIKQLQENPGPISPEDQALLDQLQASNEATTTKLEALDALTAPTPPPA